MPVTLTVMKGVHQGRQIPIAVPEFLIGRDPACHLRPASKEVHWQHCAVVTREDGIFLRDDAGMGQTHLNERMLRGGEMQLAHGDRIRVGPLHFQVTLLPQVVLDCDESADNGDDDEEAKPRASGPDTQGPRRTGTGDTNVTASARPVPPVVIRPMRDAREILCAQ